MSLEIAITENTAALRDLIAALALQSPGAIAYAQQKALVLEPPEDAPAPEEKPKRRKAAPAAAPAVEAPAPAPTPPPEEPAAPAITFDDLKTAFLSLLISSKGRDAGVALLRDFGVGEGGKLSDIPADQWGRVMVEIHLRSLPEARS